MERKQSKSCEYPVKTPCEEDPYMWNMLMENRNKLRAWNYFCIVSIAIDQYEIRKNVCIEQQKTHIFGLGRFLNFIEFGFFFSLDLVLPRTGKISLLFRISIIYVEFRPHSCVQFNNKIKSLLPLKLLYTHIAMVSIHI